MRYKMYGMFLEHTSRRVRKATRASKKSWPKRPDQKLEYIGRAMQLHNTINMQILSQEHAWFSGKRVLVFPEDPSFLEFLHEARMEIQVEDLPLTPPFMVAWPQGLVLEGVTPYPCIASWQRSEEYKGQMSKTVHTTYPSSAHVMVSDPSVAEGDLELALSTDLGTKEWGYTNILGKDLDFALSKAESYEAWVQAPRLSDMLTKTEMSPEENVVERLTARLVVRLLAFMRACPDHILNGWPHNVCTVSLEGARPSTLSPLVLKNPGIQEGTQGSPKTHWRTWYLRRYPTKPDGSRRAGLVFVRETVVNADVDPKTVVKDLRRTA